MGLLNYSTTIGAERTLGEIQATLARAGAKSILIDYDERANPVAISFLIRTAFGDRGFRLPANLDAVFRVLERQYKQGKVQRRFVTKDQAARVGWRIVLDWIKAQMAIIEAEMVTLDQVMLPYMTEGNRSLYQVMAEQQLMLPAPSKG